MERTCPKGSQKAEVEADKSQGEKHANTAVQGKLRKCPAVSPPTTNIGRSRHRECPEDRKDHEHLTNLFRYLNSSEPPCQSRYPSVVVDPIFDSSPDSSRSCSTYDSIEIKSGDPASPPAAVPGPGPPNTEPTTEPGSAPTMHPVAPPTKPPITAPSYTSFHRVCGGGGGGGGC